ncbi:hypothetical protein HAX54_028002, partial [Datura stramonium]|nr:hypothetical protein [Datura stramonium]
MGPWTIILVDIPSSHLCLYGRELPSCRVIFTIQIDGPSSRRTDHPFNYGIILETHPDVKKGQTSRWSVVSKDGSSTWPSKATSFPSQKKMDQLTVYRLGHQSPVDFPPKESLKGSVRKVSDLVFHIPQRL